MLKIKVLIFSILSLTLVVDILYKKKSYKSSLHFEWQYDVSFPLNV